MESTGRAASDVVDFVGGASPKAALQSWVGNEVHDLVAISV
jgi:hypothetical protein